MKKGLIPALTLVAAVSATLYFWPQPAAKKDKRLLMKEGTEVMARFHKARMQYEFDLIKDPATGKIPEGIFEREKALARRMPERQNTGETVRTLDGARVLAANSYIPAGPNNIGGRTRAVAYDQRYATTGVIIAGSVSGGILRSANRGSSWTLVTPLDNIHSFTALAQDPRNPDVWYAAGGEAYGNSTSEIGAPYMGYGIWKSVNNGASWTMLPLTNITGAQAGTSLEAFDHPFDYVHRMYVNPVNSHLYVAAHRRVLRSTDGGNSYEVIFGSATAANSNNGQTDVTVTGDGRVFIASNGGNPDRSLRGVFVSATGALGSFTRIAGGQTVGVDSLTGWRGNDQAEASRRIQVAIAPSNHNIAYVMYENGLSADDPELKPEADLWRLDVAGNAYNWSNRSENMPDFPNGNLSGSDPISLQGGYNLMVRVKPDDPNTVFIGGTNLYRSTNGFTNTEATAWINGYNTNFTYQLFPDGHPDIHELTFNPANPNEAICGNDGGIQITNNILAPLPDWIMAPNYQTLQYYYVAMDPDAGRNNFAGGAQDNGTHFRDKLGLLPGVGAADSNNHFRLIGGDGCAVGISRIEQANAQNQFLYGSSQYGNIYRVRLTNGLASNNIRPSNLTPAFPGATAEYGEFITNFRLNPDNTEDLYYVNFNRLFRTTTASSVSGGGWTELTNVGSTVDPNGATGGYNSIRGMAFSRGPYNTSHVLYFGTTGGRIYRIDDPRNADAAVTPVNITPSGMAGNVQNIAVNPNNDEEVLAVITNYGVTSIWHTTNGKSATPTWRGVEGNLSIPSVRSCAIVVRKDASNIPITEYYVGTSIGLYSTGSVAGSPTWVREGGSTLNYAVIQHLVYRPVDNVLLVGTHGNGMYYAYAGTPDFRPNLSTGIDPVTNDPTFVRSVFPTSGGGPVQYRTGTLTGIRRITLELTDATGRTVYRKEAVYGPGQVDVPALARGTYFLTITSNNRKYRHVQTLVRNNP